MPQVGKAHDLHGKLLLLHPNAGPRTYSRRTTVKKKTKKRKGGGEPAEIVVMTELAAVKFWRGYYLVVLVDRATQAPIVWTLRNAQWDEARAIKEILFFLDEEWPDSPLERVGADSAWDENWAYEYCEGAGVHLIAARGRAKIERNAKTPLPFSEGIGWFDERGMAWCRHHQLPMHYVGAQFAGDKRTRWRCPHGCEGTPGIQMSEGWAALPYYPHHSVGRPDLHAMRLAILARRNSCEALFSGLKCRQKLGLAGAARTRLTDYDSVLALISLALMLRTAFLLASVRIEQGLHPDVPPPELLGLL
jgi:hypothetical protein